MLKKVTHSVVLMFVASGCGGASASDSTGTSGDGTVANVTDVSTTAALPSATGGTYGKHSSTRTTGDAPSANATGGAHKDSQNSGDASGGTRAVGGSSGGEFTRGTGGVAAAGAFNGGGSTGGGTGECVPVCSLYGAPCCLWQTSCLRPTNGCTIDVLAAAVGTTYQYDELESKVSGLPPDLSASITDQDIAWAAADPWPASRIEIHLTDAAATRHAAVLDGAKDGRAFRVSCAGQSLFVGVFYLIYGAAALDTPVLHFARENGVSVLRLGAF
ncbi:MAG TPA: hypothetical protein VKP30_30685, partial [Polyangiaceae bacterium]|nr:hypothetical protein [Polyangiaceae bacterium]